MQPTPEENPYASPNAPSEGQPTVNADAKSDKPPFAHQAVRFSLYAPVLLAATNWVVRDSLGNKHAGTTVFAWISVLTIVAAFALGIIGMVGSLRRWSIWSTFLGLFATLLNGAILFALVRYRL